MIVPKPPRGTVRRTPSRVVVPTSETPVRKNRKTDFGNIVPTPHHFYTPSCKFHQTFYEDCHPDLVGADKNGPWPVHTKYGDGTEIEDEVMSKIRQVVWDATVAVPMKLGSLLVVDN